MAIELTEEAAYSKAELAAYDTYWDAVRTEKSMLSDRYNLGKMEGITEILLFLLEQKFGVLPMSYHQKIKSADYSQLKNWLERVNASASLEEVFKVDLVIPEGVV